MIGEPCKTCSASVDRPESKHCRKCYNAHQKSLPSRKKYSQKKAWKNKPSYKKQIQEKAWYTYPKTCEVCGGAYNAINKNSRLCPVCYARKQELRSFSKTGIRYKQRRIDDRQITEHRYLAEQLFGRILNTNDDIHHLDENPRNNELTNLLVLSHSGHLKLHNYLDRQRVIEEQQGNPRPWAELILPLSLQWLRDNKIPHLRLSELKAFKDQLLKHPKIGKQPDYVQRLLEDRIQWRLYPGSFKITA